MDIKDNKDIKGNKENKDCKDNIAKFEVFKDDIENLFKRLKYFFPQFDMNGDNNIWILKPSGLSRGRGIACISNLNELLTFIKKNSSQFIIQKYIENPLIILQRKVIILIIL